MAWSCSIVAIVFLESFIFPAAKTVMVIGAMMPLTWRLASNLQWSVSLNKHLTDRKDIHVAVGLDVGKVIVSRLGKRGEKINICFGPEVSEAERLQVISSEKQIRISTSIYEELDDEDITEEFTKRGSAYVATALTFPKLDEKKEEKAAENGSLAATVENGRVHVSTSVGTVTRPWHSSKPWRSV